MSTDSDPPTDDELVRELVRDELEQMLEEADIDLDDLPQEKGTTRRDVLKAAGLAGAAGLTGAAGMNSATEPASAGSSSAGDWGTADNPGDFYSEDHYAVDQASGGLTTPPTGFLNFGFESGTPRYVDSAGTYRDLTPFTDGDGDGVYTLPNAGDGVDVGSVDTDELNSIVFADQYDTLQAAADATPAGGMLYFPTGDYDVASLGTISSSTPLTVAGAGWFVDDAGNYHGAVIRNSGGDTTDSPIIDVSATADHQGGGVRNLAIIHEGGTTPAIRYENDVRTETHNVAIDLNNTGSTGVRFAGGSFFGRVTQSWIRRAADYGVRITGNGGAHAVVNCHTTSTAAGSVGVRIERPSGVIWGGQHDGDSAGMQFYNPEASAMSGGLVGGEVWVENSTTGVDIDGASQFNQVTVQNIKVNLGGVSQAIRFGNSSLNTVVTPTVGSPGSTGDLALFTADSARDQLWLDPDTARATITDNGAYEPLMVVFGACNDTTLSNIDTTIPVWVPLRITGTAGGTDWSPVFYDTAAASWYEQSSANTAFTP